MKLHNTFSIIWVKKTETDHLRRVYARTSGCILETLGLRIISSDPPDLSNLLSSSRPRFHSFAGINLQA
jgi:hypothetical protein